METDVVRQVVLGDDGMSGKAGTLHDADYEAICIGWASPVWLFSESSDTPT